MSGKNHESSYSLSCNKYNRLTTSDGRTATRLIVSIPMSLFDCVIDATAKSGAVMDVSAVLSCQLTIMALMDGGSSRWIRPHTTASLACVIFFLCFYGQEARNMSSSARRMNYYCIIIAH